MEIGEQIAVGGLTEELESECPFKHEDLGVDSVEPEDIRKDESDPAREQQENDGGVLGRNLESASNGAEGTVGGPYPPPEAKQVKRRDTQRSGVRVWVSPTDTIPGGIYGFTVAAHHLIPGEASLEPSPLKAYMTQDGSVEVKTVEGRKRKRVRRHIGYNVNGAHNGVWLPGNYYIRGTTSPVKGTTWSDLGDNPWCLKYVAAVTKVAHGQFHDTHSMYSESVKELLTKIATIISFHECNRCNLAEVNPPFQIKNRLYRLSEYLRMQVTAPPQAWKRPWFTSDRWRGKAFAGGRPSKEFLRAYGSAAMIEDRGSRAASGG